MYGLALRSAIAVWLVVSCSVAHASFVADYRIDTGASVAEQWVRMNASSGEVLSNFTQIISTCMNQNSGSLNSFKRNLEILNDPTSGIAAASPLMEISGRKKDVCKDIHPNAGVKQAGQADRQRREKGMDYA